MSEPKYTTREVAKNLQRYALMLDSERLRWQAIYEIDGTDASNIARSRLAEEVEYIQEMASYLWDLKERV